MTVQICPDKDAACDEFLPAARCADCPTLKQAEQPAMVTPYISQAHFDQAFPAVQPAPPFGDKRKAAMTVYTPPFKYQHGYIFDSQNLMVADNGPISGDQSVEGAVAARVRGWGKLSYLPNGAELQDEIGQMMADALNALYANTERPASVELRSKQEELAACAAYFKCLYPDNSK